MRKPTTRLPYSRIVSFASQPRASHRRLPPLGTPLMGFDPEKYVHTIIRRRDPDLSPGLGEL